MFHGFGGMHVHCIQSDVCTARACPSAEALFLWKERHLCIALHASLGDRSTTTVVVPCKQQTNSRNALSLIFLQAQ
jgi:hypothetical protein